MWAAALNRNEVRNPGVMEDALQGNKSKHFPVSTISDPLIFWNPGLVRGALFKHAYSAEGAAAAEPELQQATMRQAEEVTTGLVCMQAVYPSCSLPLRQIMAPEVIEGLFKGIGCLFPMRGYSF